MGYSSGKEFAPMRVDPKEETKLKMAELLPLRVYPFTLHWEIKGIVSDYPVIELCRCIYG